MAEPATRKALAFARFAARWPRYKGRRLQDFFYDQACAALGICNHSTWVRISPNDPRWDKICPPPTALDKFVKESEASNG